jgi:nitroimidazol reductase NimA-like FMN-containing flavoprotein (pyridoxamine 5'-phosphate oxidase superfamily)
MLNTLTEKETNDFLKSRAVGRIGCTNGTDVYVVPINYRMEEVSVLCYSLEGLKIDIMRKHPAVCFEVDEIQDSNHWKCVLINGVFEEITDPGELDLLKPHYTEYLLRKRVSINYPPDTAEQLDPEKNKTANDQVHFRIRFDKVSGRVEDGFF